MSPENNLRKQGGSAKKNVREERIAQMCVGKNAKLFGLFIQ